MTDTEILADRPIIVDHPMVHPPGVYFGMPEADYHAKLALSATGIKSLGISSYDWWIRSPLNEKRVEEATPPMIIGKAFHKRIIEGEEAFERSHAAKLNPEDYPDALRTINDLTAVLLGHLVRAKSSDRKADLIRQVLEVEPDAVIWDQIVERHQAEHAGKTLLDRAVCDRIREAARMIEEHPQLYQAFTGGAPEVSIFWIDRTTGVPCKARLDYLKPRAIVDLKSFDPRGQSLDRAIIRSFINFRYHVQAAWYLRAAEEARQLLAEGEIYSEGDVSVAQDYLEQLIEAPERTFLFVWQSTGLAPVVKGKVLPSGIVLDVGHFACEEALVLWRNAWLRWGTSPWIETYDIEIFNDADFPYLRD